MRYRITFAFQLWWYFNHDTLLWHPFHEFHLKSYDKYAVKVDKKPIDPSGYHKFKVGNYWYIVKKNIKSPFSLLQ